jgi:hypothetical protein
MLYSVLYHFLSFPTPYLLKINSKSLAVLLLSRWTWFNSSFDYFVTYYHSPHFSTNQLPPQVPWATLLRTLMMAQFAETCLWPLYSTCPSIPWHNRSHSMQLGIELQCRSHPRSSADGPAGNVDDMEESTAYDWNNFRKIGTVLSILMSMSKF